MYLYSGKKAVNERKCVLILFMTYKVNVPYLFDITK